LLFINIYIAFNDGQRSFIKPKINQTNESVNAEISIQQDSQDHHNPQKS